VEGHAVVGLLVDTLEDINLAALWPIGSDRPEPIETLAIVNNDSARFTHAGHVPQPNGMCAMSKTISPLSYFFLLSRRMLGLPPGVLFVTSTPNFAVAVEVVLMRLDCLAVFSSTYFTNPFRR
jgi:hypothetical protein